MKFGIIFATIATVIAQNLEFSDYLECDARTCYSFELVCLQDLDCSLAFSQLLKCYELSQNQVEMRKCSQTYSTLGKDTSKQKFNSLMSCQNTCRGGREPETMKVCLQLQQKLDECRVQNECNQTQNLISYDRQLKFCFNHERIACRDKLQDEHLVCLNVIATTCKKRIAHEFNIAQKVQKCQMQGLNHLENNHLEISVVDNQNRQNSGIKKDNQNMQNYNQSYLIRYYLMIILVFCTILF